MSDGVKIEDATTAHSFLDYLLVAADPGEQFALGVNVKNAGRQMEKAQDFFGLASDDTIPMATYKAFGAEKGRNIRRSSTCIWSTGTLLERLRERTWGSGLYAAQPAAFELMASFKGFPRALEDDFVAATVEARIGQLRAEVGYAEQKTLLFRAISAARCTSIFYEQHERSPYVYVQKMKTDPNVHVSVKGETGAFPDLMRDYLATPAKRRALIKD